MTYTADSLKRFKWPVSASQKIEASPHQIWLTITKPGNLEECHPFCEKNPVYQWPGVGSRDAIHYYSGWVMYREFVNWIDGVGYDLTIGKEDERKSYVSWRITEEPDGTGRLSISIYPQVFQNWPLVIRWIPHVATIRPGLHSYLVSVLRGFEWFITTGKPVRKNQFGSHKWFSDNNG